MEDVTEVPHLLVRVHDPEDAGALRRTVAKTAAHAGIAALGAAPVIHRDNAGGSDDATAAVVQLGEGDRR